MTSAGFTKKNLVTRITVGLAAASAVFGIVAFSFAGGGASSNQADEPWACNRDGSVCYDY